MKRIRLIIASCLLYLPGLHAQVTNQSDADQLSKLTIPSPTAAAMASFTDIPVSLYTGTPNIAIPVYEINTGKLRLPITLRYQGTGIRVTENAGNVGLGWSLEAQGSITKIVYGNEDDGSYQLAGGLSWEDAGLIKEDSADYQLLYNLSVNSLDGAPDLYLYNFGKKAGRFIDVDGVKLLPHDNLDVTRINDNGADSWKIIDDDGKLYYFSAKEISANKSSAGVSRSATWYLTKIVDPNHVDSILFNYENTLEDLGIGFGYSGFAWSPNNGTGVGWTEFVGGQLEQFSQVVTGKQLKEIVFNNGSVYYDIGWNERCDMTTGSPAINTPIVKNIFIKDKSGAIIKTVHFEQDCYTTASNLAPQLGKRLRLQSVSFVPTLNDLGTPIEQKYSLVYNSTNLALKNSRGQDHWGYNNGKVMNTTFIPNVRLPNFHYDNGADRETNPNYVKAGILEKIIYPTGGFSLFDFEANTVGPPYAMDTLFHDTLKATFVASTDHNFVSEESDFISIPNSAVFANGVSATFTASLGIGGNTTSESISHAGGKAKLIEMSGSTEVTKASFSFSFSANGDYSTSIPVLLDPAKTYYILVTVRDPGFSMQANLLAYWPTVAPASNRYVGGCRIKRIINYDPLLQDSLIRTYTYNFPDSVHSSGELALEPVYYQFIHKFLDPDILSANSNNTPCNEINILGINLSSNSFVNVGAGSHVGYSVVTETIGKTGQGGKNVYYYSNFNDIERVPGQLNPSWRRGLLIKKEVFNNVGTLFAKSTNKYRFQDRITYAGHTATDAGKHPCSDGFAFSAAWPVYFNQHIVSYPSEWIVNDSIFEQDFTTGLNSLVINQYDNAQHMLPGRTTTFMSDGSKVTSFVKYPTDFTLTGTLNSNEAEAIKLLQDKHMHNIPLERYSQKWLPNAASPMTIGATYTGFRTAGVNGSVVLTNKRYELRQDQAITNFQPLNVSGNVVNKDSRYAEMAAAKEYDKRTNLVTLTAPGNQNAGYVWGYNNTFPIASVSNNNLNRYRGFTSFEKDAPGNWNYTETAVSQSEMLTGKRSLDLAVASVGISFTASDNLVYGTSNSATPGNYIVSYWRKGGVVTVNGTSPSVTGTTTSSGWTYCEHILNNPASVSVNGNTKIDELRFYPVESMMESYTYDPLIGITSVDDGSSNIIFYEYDAMGRLSIERDIFGKIIKKHTYQYQVTE